MTVATDAPLARAAELMAEHGISHLAVVDPVSKRPVGILSTLDIARSIASASA